MDVANPIDEPETKDAVAELQERFRKADKRQEYENELSKFKDEPIEKVIDMILKIKHPVYRAICDVAFITASRISEVLRLRKEDVEIEPDGSAIAFTLWTEKRRDKDVLRKTPISKAHFPEFAPLIDDFINYWKKRRIDDLAPEAFIFGNPGYFNSIRKYELKTKKNPDSDEELKPKYKTKVYSDNRMRSRVAMYLRRHLNLHPHMLRHRMLTYLIKVSKPQFEGLDRAYLIQSFVNYANINSARPYLKTMTFEEKKKLF